MFTVSRKLSPHPLYFDAILLHSEFMCPNESWPELNSKLVANGCLKVHCASRLNVMCMRINIPQRQVLSCTVSFFLLILLSNQNILLLCFEPVLNTREILFP